MASKSKHTACVAFEDGHALFGLRVPQHHISIAGAAAEDIAAHRQGINVSRGIRALRFIKVPKVGVLGPALGPAQVAGKEIKRV